MRMPVYKALAVYSQDSDDVTLEDFSSTQQHEENPLNSWKTEETAGTKQWCQVSYSCLKISHLYLTNSWCTITDLIVCKNFLILEH